MISDADGIHKPDCRIFQRALGRLNASPDRAVFVGDHPEVDVAGARAVGMQAVWRRDPRVSRMVEADAVIKELRDLLSLLGLERGGYKNSTTRTGGRLGVRRTNAARERWR